MTGRVIKIVQPRILANILSLLILGLLAFGCSSSPASTPTPAPTPALAPAPRPTSTSVPTTTPIPAPITPEGVVPTTPPPTSMPSNEPSITVVVPSVEDEVVRIWNTLAQIDFFDDYGYKLTFPAIDEMDTLLQKARAKELQEIDYSDLLLMMEEKIFHRADYSQAYDKVVSYLPVIEQVFPTFDEYARKWGFKIFPEYKVLLTLYGVGGSYDPQKGHITLWTTPDGTFARGSDPTPIIIHEMVHIGIQESIIQAYSIDHKIKERIVDLFVYDHFLSLVPDYYMQSIGDTSIDQFLTEEGAWDNLPTRIEEFKSK